MENKKIFELAKLWNILLEKSVTNPSEAYFNLNNYAFRMEMQLNSKTRTCDEETLKRVNDFIGNSSNLNAYLSRERERFNLKCPKQNAKSIVEVFDLSNSETNKSLNLKEAQVSKTLNIQQEATAKELSNESKPTDLSETELNQLLFSFKQCLVDEQTSRLKSLIIEIAQKYPIEDLKKICKSDFNLTEAKLSLIMETLFETNSAENNLSYNASYAFLGILSDYVKIKLVNETESGQVLSRQMFTLCSTACNKFTRQFIFSCLTNWICLLNESLDEKQKLTNKLLTEFLVKLVKDCFEETNSILLLQHLTANYFNIKWTENIWIIVSALIDKISNFKFELFKVIVEKMLHDSKDMCKSSVFGKLLLNLMNKFKQMSANQPKNRNNQDSTEEMQTDSFELVDSNTNKATNQSSKNSDTQWMNNIFLIIENNQTILKRSLLNIANSFKLEI